MNFNPFKKKTTHIDFYTFDAAYHKNDKPTLKADYPSWCKNMELSIKVDDKKFGTKFDVGTAKGCPGIKNFMKEGIKFHLWEELKLRIMPDGTVIILPLAFEPKNPPYVQHYPPQFKGMYPDNVAAFKLNTPWYGICKDETNFIFVESHYSTRWFRENNAVIAPGYINFKYQHALNCHILMPTDKEPYDITMPYGLPLFTLFPVSEKKLTIDHHAVTKEEMANIGSPFPQCPVGKYYHYVKNMKGNSES